MKRGIGVYAHLDPPKAPHISPKSGLIIRACGRNISLLQFRGHVRSMPHQKRVQWAIFEKYSCLHYMHVRGHARTDGLQESEEK